MNLLALDTSTHCASVALQMNDRVTYLAQAGVSQHAKRLLPMIDQLMQEAEITPDQLDGIVFGQGPGSFTGIRIACSVAKALAFAFDRPLFPVSSLQAIAYNAQQIISSPMTSILAMIDARMGEVYWAYFTDLIASAEQVTAIDAIKIPGSESFVLAGVGFDEYLLACPQLKQQSVQQLEVFPTAQAMLALVQSQHIPAIDAEAAVPVYIRNQVTHRGSHG